MVAVKKEVRATETVGNALEAESYSKASSTAFISLFLISITSLYIERETGIEPATSSLGKWTFLDTQTTYDFPTA